MKFKNLFILPVILVLGACSTTYTPETDQSSDYNFSAAKTFNVVGDDKLKNPMISDINRSRIDSALISSLIKQGKTEANINSADVIISYFIVTKDKVKVTSSYSGRYGRYGVHGYGGVSGIDARDYVEGTLIIDVIDNESQKTIWRSTLKKSLKSYDDSADRELAINNAVSSMMESFPSTTI
jgi:hypothetical protein